MSEMLAQVPSASYVERVSLHHPKYIRKAKKAIFRGFRCQMEHRGFSMVEVLSTCPTGWGLDPIESLEWLEVNMIPYYPLGVFRAPEEV
jgi:2-oxoglutarate ferredoxin oxidoreductase subunit beta